MEDKSKQLKGNPFFALRSRNDQKDPTHKSAVLMDQSAVPANVYEDDFATNYLSKIAKLPGNRPVAKVGSPSTSPLKRPLYVLTPEGSKLNREKAFGFFVYFSNKELPEYTRVEPIQIPDEVVESLQDSQGHIKHQAVVLDTDFLDQLSQTIRREKRGKKGIPTQNQCMARDSSHPEEASASKNAAKLGIAQPNEMWEWLHLIAFFIKGKAAQSADNLTGGTKHANTDMMLFEDQLPYLTEHLKEQVCLQVSAPQIKGSHFAKEIHYTIVTKHFTLPFIVDAQTSIAPSRGLSNYIRALVDTFVESTKEIINNGATVRRRLDSPSSILFFNTISKPEEEEEEKENIKPASNQSSNM